MQERLLLCIETNTKNQSFANITLFAVCCVVLASAEREVQDMAFERYLFLITAAIGAQTTNTRWI